MAEQTTNLHIPVDITFDILSRLAVKSLLRFKSVSKTWCAIIQDPIFIEKHRIRSALNPNQLLRYYLCNKNRYRVLHRDGTIDKPIEIDFYPHLPEDPFSRKDIFYVMDVSNGLVFVRGYGLDCSGLFILNPATRQFRQLLALEPQDDPYEFLFVGKGFAPGFNYSLLRVFRNYTRENSAVVIRAEKYNLSSGDWRDMNLKIRDINALEPHDTYGTKHMIHILLNGVFYSEVFFGHKSMVACLDICSATYDEITTPESSLINVPAHIQTLIELKGELTLIVYGMPQSFWAEFWVLNESGRNWTKNFTIKDTPIINGLPRVVGCSGYDELIVHDFDHWKLKLFSYDMNTGEIKTVDSEGIGMYDYPYIYAESLLPVNEINGAKNAEL